MHPSAGSGILPFGVLANAQDIEALRTQGTGDAWQQPVRANVGVLDECLADRQEKTVQRHRVGHLCWPAHRAEIDRIEGTQRLDPVLRHHGTGLLIVLAGPRKCRTLEVEFVLAGCGLQDGPGGCGYILADTIAWDQRYRIALHGLPSQRSMSTLFDLQLAK